MYCLIPEYLEDIFVIFFLSDFFSWIPLFSEEKIKAFEIKLIYQINMFKSTNKWLSHSFW